MYINPENNSFNESTSETLSPRLRLKKIHSIDRHCFFCHNKIKFWFFYHCYNDLGPEKLAEVWQDDSFKLYCRSCFEELKNKNIKKFLGKKELKNRNCWNCGKKLTFSEYMHRNLDTSPKRLVELWQSPYLEIYCCNCHDKEKDRRKHLKLIKRSEMIKENLLVAEEREALRFIEKKIGRKIPHLYYINYFGSFGFRQKDGHIISLALSNCELKSLPEEIRVFSHLEKLSVDRNPFAIIPHWIKRFKQLRWINLFNRELVETKKNISLLKQLQKENPELLIISKYYYSDEKFLKLSEHYSAIFSKFAYFTSK